MYNGTVGNCYEIFAERKKEMGKQKRRKLLILILKMYNTILPQNIRGFFHA